MAFGLNYKRASIGDVVFACASIALAICTIQSIRLGVRAFAILLLIGAAAKLVTWASSARRQRASIAWPAVRAAVQSAEVRKNWQDYPFDGAYLLKVEYIYDPGDGRHIASEERRFWKKSSALTEAARLRSASVVVKYDPRKPAISLLT